MKFTFRNLIAAANEALRPQIGMVCASNELVDVGQGWYEIPYGEYPHKEGLQILEAVDAEQMVAAFNDIRGKDPTFKAAIYVGHPDHPDAKVAGNYPDKAAYGWIDQVAAGNTGFRFHADWNPNGRQLVEGKSYRYFSPLFWLQPVGNVGRKVIRPRIFQSIGLTNTPNMGGCWVGNDQQTATQGDPMNNLLERLKALINKDSVQTEDDVVGFVQRMLDALKKLYDAQQSKWTAENVAYDVAENEDVINHAATLIAGIDGLVAAANDAVPESVTAQIAGLTEQIATLTTERDAAQGLVAGANEGAAAAFVQLAIAQGKLKPADKDTQIQALVAAEDLVAAGNALLAADPVIKTEAKAVGLKVVDMNAAQKREGQIAAANTIQGEHAGLTFQQAWRRAQKDDRFAALFTKEDAAE